MNELPLIQNSVGIFQIPWKRPNLFFAWVRDSWTGWSPEGRKFGVGGREELPSGPIKPSNWNWRLNQWKVWTAPRSRRNKPQTSSGSRDSIDLWSRWGNLPDLFLKSERTKEAKKKEERENFSTTIKRKKKRKIKRKFQRKIERKLSWKSLEKEKWKEFFIPRESIQLFLEHHLEGSICIHETVVLLIT